ncbi:MAG: TonB-dependent receptor [Mediterranea sp.]|jgi:hypothetical protein|nr:TonB-dependent receptor [Mediterranea sp.]
MKKHFLCFLLTAGAMLLGNNAFSQVTVKGQLVDAESNDPLIGASVMAEGTSQGTVTNVDGQFSLRVESGTTLVFRYVGYKEFTRRVTQRGGEWNLGTLIMESDAEVLGDVVVTASMAVSRKTPIAVSTLEPAFIEEKLGGQEFPEVLKSTPGVYVTQQGGGYGDSEIFMRGFSQDNIAVNINGSPVNDMEWGGIYWSNWDGLRDVTRTMQTQRGLGASKVSAPSVGGTINIITRGLEAKKGGYVSYTMGNDGINKILFSANTGLSKKGWAMNFLLSKSWGDGYIQGGTYEAYNYYLNIAKRINDQHQLSLSIIGSPQRHNQRGSQDGLTLSGWEATRDVYGVSDYRYNPSFGYRANGQTDTGIAVNVYHKPQITLNHQWTIDYKSYLNTSVYASIGRGYGHTGMATFSQFTKYSYQDWYGASYGSLRTAFRNTDGTFNYGAIEELNASSEYGSQLAVAKNKNYHDWVGLLSTYTTKFGEHLDFYGGVDFRYYKGRHTAELTDLYGGKYFMDSTRGAVLAENNARAADPDWKYEKLGVGDVVYRDYDGNVVQEGAFFQGEYNLDKLSAFVSGSLSNTSYWTVNRFYYDAEHEKSKTVSYLGYTFKGGANYNLTKNHNVFANVGYISRAPRLDGGAFFQARTSTITNPDAKNEKIFSAEVGYGWRNSWLKLDINGYYTKWMDKTMARRGTLSNQAATPFVMNMEGVDALHKGIEVEIKAKPLEWLELNGMFSLGDWRWANNATGYAYSEETGQPIDIDGNQVELGSEKHLRSRLMAKDIRVGGAAQTTASVGANVNVTKEIRVGIDWNFQGNNYSYYTFNASALANNGDTYLVKPWRIPSASQFDMNASYRFKFAGLNAVLSGNVNNLFDTLYLRKAYNPSSTSSNDTTVADQTNVYGYYSFGRTFTVRLRVNF